MAVSKLWPVTVRLATVLDYASNPEKTTKSKSKYSDADYQALRDVVAYAKDGEKTERELFCEGIHCNPQTAREQFITVKEQFDKPDGIQAYHGYLSFEETDITPELAQQVGMAFAERMWGDRFQVLVTTHLNTEHLHCHFVVNSVSFRDGKRLQNKEKAWWYFRHIADEVCLEHGLSVVQNPEAYQSPRILTQKDKAGMPTRYNLARTALDEAIAMSHNLRQLEYHLSEMGYTLGSNPKRKYWTIKGKGDERPIRLHRLGDEYTKERITQRLIENRDNIDFEPFQPKIYRPKQYRLRTRSDRIGKVGGLYGLYLYYCYRLGYLPKYKAGQQNHARVHYLFKEDLMKIDELTKQVTLLGKHHIGTDEQLFSYQHSVEEQVKTLTADRTHLRNEIRKVNITDAELLNLKQEVTMTKKKQVGVRFDSNRTRLKTGETQRPNGTYAYRWSTPDGKRHSIYAPTLEKLREQEEQIIVDKHDGIRSDVKSITVNEMFNLWCQLKRGIKDSTFKNYIYMYELFVKPSFGKNRLVQVKKSDVRKFYNSLADGKVLKIATIDNVHNVLHQVFQVAVDDGMIRQNPTDNMLKELKLSHGFEREKKEALTVAQQKLFFDYMLSHPKDTHWYPVFYVMANTGMRVGEITGLRWSDIDLKKGIIRVNHTLVYYNHRDEKGCYFSINTPKTKAGEREIPMTEGVKQAFLMEREFQSQAEISSKSRVDGYDDFIFVNRYGDVQNQGNLNKALRRMMRDCNDEILEKYGADSDPVLLPQFSCHILRHTFATRLCESGANLKFIQSILGHADVSTTMNIYVDVTDALKKKEITAFDDYMTTKLET